MAYSTASLVFVEDLLSVLDERTASMIFNALFGLGGLLHQQRRTAVLATRCRKAKTIELLKRELIDFWTEKYMADAGLAIFLDGKGHVITREAGAQFALVPQLQSVMTQLSDAKIDNNEQKSSDEAASQPRNFSAEHSTPIQAIQQEQLDERESDVTTFMRLIPRNLVVACLLRMVLVAVLERIPGKTCLT